jgi:prepilin signal peptidase PulO-like enzyme (type II secretory pathway)
MTWLHDIARNPFAVALVISALIILFSEWMAWQ